MSFTARSIIFDVADNWGFSLYMAVRSIEFKLAGNLIAISTSNSAAYATTIYDTLKYHPNFAFDTTLSKIGSMKYKSWVAASGNTTSQRLICVFTAPVEFDEIVINNYHSSGVETTAGIKNTKITITDVATSDTTYNAAVSGGVVLFDGQIAQHVASDVVDDQSLPLVLIGPATITLGGFELSASADMDVGVGLSLPPFDAALSLDCGSIYEGFLVSDITFDLAATISATPAFAIPLPPFNISADLVCGSTYVGYFATLEPFDLTGSMSADIGIGVTPTFNATADLGTDLSVQIDGVIFDTNASLGSDVSVSIPVTFNGTSGFEVGGAAVLSYANPSILFFFTLTGSPDGLDDVQIPISSFQARHRSGKPSFLSVTIPGTDYADEITARPNGELVIRMAKSNAGAVYHSEEILRASLDEIRPDDGGRNKSITLTGYGTSTSSPKTVALQGVVYRSGSAGKLRYRLATPDIFLRPGDTAAYDGDEITVETITYTVNVQRQQMELAE